MNPNFFAVIPASIRYDKELSSSAKLFYGEITAMSNQEGYCWASNSYFSEVFGVGNSTISLWIKQLSDLGHVEVDYDRKGKSIVARKIYPIQKIETTYSENQKKVFRKSKEGYSENRKGNTTSNNTTSIIERREQFANKIRSLSNDLPKDEVDKFIDYWTEKNPKGRKMRFEKEKTFDPAKRLATWKRNYEKFKEKSSAKKERKRYDINDYNENEQRMLVDLKERMVQLYVDFTGDFKSQTDEIKQALLTIKPGEVKPKYIELRRYCISKEGSDRKYLKNLNNLID
jgi:hypothetical protein